jgi:ectoine hydroxylase-related dioxygenase (phytanoyl-CoA dioxygenase family)
VKTGIVQDAKPFSAEQTSLIKTEFLRDGYRVIRGVLSREEVAALRAAVDAVFADPVKAKDPNKCYGPFIAVRLFEDDPLFEDLLTREPIISLVENILGETCHLVANNVVRNAPGQAIDKFHADELVFFPLPEGIARHDPRVTMPVFLLTVQILLTDVPSVEYGPTEFVPGSHYSGRPPNDPKKPTFERRGPVALLGNAGDIYLHNGQCWHRGAPNTSDRTRYLLQMAFGARWVSQRFYPFVNYQLPAHVLDRADERRRRVLGFHPKGPYG